MPNQYKNKVIYGNQTLIDLTSDTITADKLLPGYTAHDATGALITGTCEGIQIPIPVSGTNTFWVAVPNGTLDPDPSEEEDWIKLEFEVDSLGESNVTASEGAPSGGLTAAEGVKF